MKISVITLHRVFNFGSFLQAYALQEYLTKRGHTVEFVDYRPSQLSNKSYFWCHDKQKYNNFASALAYNAAVFPKRFGRKRIFDAWIERYLHLSKKQYHTYREIEANVPAADAYLTGSDQVWNSEYNRGVDPAWFLDYAPPAKPRFAYAASFGRTELHPYEVEPITQMVEKYQAISVREKSGVEVLRKLGRADACHVLDPTLLLTHEEWQQKLIDNTSKIKEKYLLIYQLNHNPFMIETAVKIAKERNLKVVKLSLNTRVLPGIDYVFNNITPQDFLSLFHYAEIVVTDSFHGVAFSVNFGKELIIIPPGNYATRLLSLAEIMGLSERVLIDKNSQLEPMNHQVVSAKLAEERRKSYEYLTQFF